MTVTTVSFKLYYFIPMLV